MVEYFKVSLADMNIEVECVHRQIFNMCKGYLAAFDEPDFVIKRCTQEEINYERLQSAEYYSDAYLETLAVYRKIADKMLNYNVLLIHGAVIAVKDKFWLFLAESGTGKTTQIKNWLSEISGAYVVNGDKPLIDMSSLTVYGTPWSGKENMNSNTAVALAGICVLERTDIHEEASIEQITFTDAFTELVKQTYRPEDTEGAVKVIELIGNFKNVPLYRMRCDNRNPKSAIMAYEHMHKGSR